MYSCHLFLISSASVRSRSFLSFIEPIFAWNVPLVSLIYLKRSLVFPILLCSSISLHWSLRKAILLSLLFFGTLHSGAYIFPFLLCLSLLFFSQLFIRPPQTAICFLAFLFYGDRLDPCLLYHITNLHPLFLRLCLSILRRSDLIPWIYFSLLLYNHKGFYLGHTCIG